MALPAITPTAGKPNFGDTADWGPIWRYNRWLAPGFRSTCDASCPWVVCSKIVILAILIRNQPKIANATAPYPFTNQQWGVLPVQWDTGNGLATAHPETPHIRDAASASGSSRRSKQLAATYFKTSTSLKTLPTKLEHSRKTARGWSLDQSHQNCALGAHF